MDAFLNAAVDKKKVRQVARKDVLRYAAKGLKPGAALGAIEGLGYAVGKNKKAADSGVREKARVSKNKTAQETAIEAGARHALQKLAFSPGQVLKGTGVGKVMLGVGKGLPTTVGKAVKPTTLRLPQKPVAKAATKPLFS